MIESLRELLESINLLDESMKTPTETVTIDLYRYEELILKERQLDMMAEAIYQGASLSYSKDDLFFDTSKMKTFLMVADNQRYLDTFNRLKGEQDGTDKD